MNRPTKAAIGTILVAWGAFVGAAAGPAAQTATPDALFTRWEVKELLPGGRFDAVAYLGEKVVVIGSRNPNPGHVFRSSDLGRNWEEVGTITPDGITCLASGGNGRAYLLTQNSEFYRSDDYGRTWKRLAQISPHRAGKRVVSYGIMLTDRATVLVSDTLATGGHIYRSTDQGVTWSDRGACSTAGLYRLERTADGVIVNGWEGSVFKSTDDGLTWHKVQNLRPEPLYATERIGPHVNVQASASGHIFISTNDGENWRDLGQLTEAPDDFVRLGSQAVLLSCYQGAMKMYLSIDQGETWKNLGPFHPGSAGDWLDHVICIEKPDGAILLGGSSKGFVVRGEVSPSH